MKSRSWLWTLGCSLLLAGSAAAVESGDKVYLVKDYRYQPGHSQGDPEVGQSLCGTRCNALSSDYLNFIEPGGWRMVKIASNQEVVLELKNPFMQGDCVCLADEYLVKRDEYNRDTSKRP